MAIKEYENIPAQYKPESYSDFRALVSQQKFLDRFINEQFQKGPIEIPGQVTPDRPNSIFSLAEVAATKLLTEKSNFYQVAEESTRPSYLETFSQREHRIDEVKRILQTHRLSRAEDLQDDAPNRWERLLAYSAIQQQTSFKVLDSWINAGQLNEKMLEGSGITLEELRPLCELALDMAEPANQIFIKQVFLVDLPDGEKKTKIFNTTSHPGAQFLYEVQKDGETHEVPMSVMFQPEWTEMVAALEKYGNSISKLVEAGKLPDMPTKNYHGLPKYIDSLVTAMKSTSTDPDEIYEAYQETSRQAAELYKTCPIQISGLASWMESGSEATIDFYLRIGYASQRSRQMSEQALFYRDVCQKMVDGWKLEGRIAENFQVPPTLFTELLLQVGTGPKDYNQGDSEKPFTVTHPNMVELISQPRIELLAKMFDLTGVDMDALKEKIIWVMCFHELMHQTPPVELDEIAKRLSINDIVTHTDILDEIRAETGVAKLIIEAAESRGGEISERDAKLFLLAQISEFLHCVSFEGADPVYSQPALTCLETILSRQGAISEPNNGEKYQIVNAKGGIKGLASVAQDLLDNLYLNGHETEVVIRSRIIDRIDSAKARFEALYKTDTKFGRFIRELRGIEIHSPRLAITEL